MLLLFLLYFQMSNLLFDLGFEFIRGATEFGEGLADVTCDLRQLLRPKDDQGENKQEDRLGETHRFIILPERERRQSRGDMGMTTKSLYRKGR